MNSRLLYLFMSKWSIGRFEKNIVGNNMPLGPGMNVQAY